MVLQQTPTKARVFGIVESGTMVEVVLDGQPVAHAKADRAGQWRAELPEQSPGTDHTLSVRSGGRMQDLQRVAFGHVLACWGQSQMLMPYGLAIEWNAGFDAGVPETPFISLAQSKVEGVTWSRANTTTIQEFSNIC